MENQKNPHKPRPLKFKTTQFSGSNVDLLHAALVSFNLDGAVGTLFGDELSQVLGHGVLVHVDEEPSAIYPLAQVLTAYWLMGLGEEGGVGELVRGRERGAQDGGRGAQFRTMWDRMVI